MTALRTQTLLARHIGERVHIITTAGGITGTLNSVAYAHEDDPQPTAVHLVATEPHDAPVTIPWHAIITFARTELSDLTITQRAERALDDLVELRRRLYMDRQEAHAITVDHIITTLMGGTG